MDMPQGGFPRPQDANVSDLAALLPSPGYYSHGAISLPRRSPLSLGSSDRQTMPSYFASQEMGSVSPQETPQYMEIFGTGTTPGSNAESAAPIPGAMIQNPKRAYRQRRKDPSCDACRERKVKVTTEKSGNVHQADCTSAMPRKSRAVPSARVATSDVSSPKTQIDACPRSSTHKSISTLVKSDKHQASARPRAATERGPVST